MIGNLEFLYSSSLFFRVPVMSIIIALVKTKPNQKNTHASEKFPCVYHSTIVLDCLTVYA